MNTFTDPLDPLELKVFYTRLLDAIHRKNLHPEEALAAIEQKLQDTRILFSHHAPSYLSDPMALIRPYIAQSWTHAFFYYTPAIPERMDWHYAQWLEHCSPPLSATSSFLPPSLSSFSDYSKQTTSDLLDCVSSHFIHLFVQRLEHSKFILEPHLYQTLLQEITERTCRLYYPPIHFLTTLHEENPSYFSTPSALYHGKYPIHHFAKQGYLDGLKFLYQRGIPFDSQDARGRDLNHYLETYHHELIEPLQSWIVEQRQSHFDFHWPHCSTLKIPKRL